MRPDLLLTGHLARRHLVQQFLGAVAQLVRRERQVFHALHQFLGIGHQLVGQRGPFVRRGGRVPVGRGPQVLLDAVPAGPRLTLGQVGLAEVQPRIQVAERLGHRLDPLPVGAGVGVECAGAVVVTGRVQGREFLGLLQQVLRFVLHELVVLLGGGRQQRAGFSRRRRRAGVGDRELGADPVAHHARLAGSDVGAGAGGDHQLAGEAGPDVLHLADDAQAVLGQQVELGDLGAVVGDVEHQVAARRLGGGETAGIVRAGDGDRVAAGRGFVVRAGGQQHQRRDDEDRDGTVHTRAFSGAVVGGTWARTRTVRRNRGSTAAM